MLCTNAFAFEHKEISTFKTLDQFKTATEFENYYNKYTKECLANSGGGGMSADYFVSIELSDEDLNI